MTGHLVPYIEPRLRRRVIWGGLAVSIGLAIFVRLLIGNEPLLSLAALLVPMLSIFFLAHALAPSEFVTKPERVRRYATEFSYWERVLGFGVIFGASMIVLQAERINTPGSAVTIALICFAHGLVVGVVLDWFNQWVQRRAGR